HTLYDGMLRLRQTQTLSLSQAAGNVGTVFRETKYDALGRTARESQHFDATVQPSTTLFTILDWQPKTVKLSQYDRANRLITAEAVSSGATQWKTVTTYGGDRISTTPPEGGVGMTMVTDALGRVVEQREYHNRADVGSNTRSLYDLTTFTYNNKGQ